MTRREALKIISRHLRDNDVAVSTTGFISREFFSASDRRANFYMVGSMGFVTPFSFGMALSRPDRKFVAIEGDGSALLNLGAMSMPGAFKARNLIVLVLDNGVYGSTGNQPTISDKIDFEKTAISMGFKNVKKIKAKKELGDYVSSTLKRSGPSFAIIKVSRGFNEKTPRVDISPLDLKKRLEEVLLNE